MSITRFPGGTVDGAIKDSNQRRSLYQHILLRLDNITQIIGFNQDNPNSPNLLPAPPPAQFTVKGQDGNFTIKITNPQNIQPGTVNQLQNLVLDPLNPTSQPIQHRLQKSTDETFSTPSLITELPLTYDTDITDKDPNVTKFWRLQSRYNGGNYNQWQFWNDPASCGPVAVWSGLLSTSSNDLLNSAATTSDGTSALSQDGTTTNILVAAKTWNVGNQQIPYSSGHVDPGSYGSWLIYAVDLKKAGGSVTYIASLHIADLTAQNGIIFFGNIKTSNAGGGTTTGGGQGGGGCVATGTGIMRMDRSETPVENLQKGDIVMGIDGGPEVLQDDPIPQFFPAFRFSVNISDVKLVCSNMHLLIREGGELQRAAELHQPYSIMHRDGVAQITDRQFVDTVLVWELRLDRTRTYCANGFWSHNKIWIPQ